MLLSPYLILTRIAKDHNGYKINFQYAFSSPKLQSVTKIMGKKMLLEQFCVSTPFPPLTMLRNNEQDLRQAMLWVRNIV